MPNNTQPDWMRPSPFGRCLIGAHKCERWRLQKGEGCCVSLWWDELVWDIPEETLTSAEKCFIIYAQSTYFCAQWGVLCDIFLSTLSLSLLALILVSGASLTVAECNAKIQIWQFQAILLWLLFCVSVFHPLSPLSLNLLRETQWCHLNTEKLQLLR